MTRVMNVDVIDTAAPQLGTGDMIQLEPGGHAVSCQLAGD